MEMASAPSEAQRNEAATRLQAVQRGHSTRNVGMNWLATSVTEVTSEFEEQGFCRNFGEFNSELVRPFKRLGEDKADAADSVAGLLGRNCRSVLATLPNPFRPASAKKRRVAFVLWNVLTMWLGVLDLVVIVLLKSELSSLWAWLIAFVDGVLGYLFAYLFYFIFISYGKQKWMLRGLVFILAYVAGTAWLTYQGVVGPGNHVQRVEAVLNSLKAFANLVVVWHGLQIYLGRHIGGGRKDSGDGRQSPIGLKMAAKMTSMV